MTATTLTIGEMCTKFEVTPRTLRFYEYKELLSPIREGQKRLFTQRDCARLKLILRGKRFGFSLDEIKDLLDLYDIDRTMLTQIAATMEVAERHLADMVSRRDELNAAIADLEAYMAEGERILAKQAASGAAA